MATGSRADSFSLEPSAPSPDDSDSIHLSTGSLQSNNTTDGDAASFVTAHSTPAEPDASRLERSSTPEERPSSTLDTNNKPDDRFDTPIPLHKPASTPSTPAPPKGSLAFQLTHPDPILIPQVLSISTHSNPSTLDTHIATPALRQALASSTHPPAVLWASFLKNNTLLLTNSNACAALQAWIEATDPTRYTHIERVEVTGYLAYRYHGRREKGGVYAPNALVAKLPNLRELTIAFRVSDLPGIERKIWEKELRVRDMRHVFDECVKFPALVTKNVRTLNVWVEWDREYMKEVQEKEKKKRMRELFGDWIEEVEAYFKGVVRKLEQAGQSVELMAEYREVLPPPRDPKDLDH